MIRILIVDDVKDTATVPCTTLLKGFTLHSLCSNGKIEDIISACETISPEIIIFNVLMKNLTKAEITFALRELGNSARIVALTPAELHKAAEHMVTALELEVDGWLHKPLRKEPVRNLLKQLKIMIYEDRLSALQLAH